MHPQTVPDAIFHTRVRNDALGGPNPFEWKKLSTQDVFRGKRIVLFGVPGAFTPACSDDHLPGFEAHAEAFRALGVDQVVCLSVNDAFVMHQWALSRNIEKVMMLRMRCLRPIEISGAHMLTGIWQLRARARQGVPDELVCEDVSVV